MPNIRIGISPLRQIHWCNMPELRSADKLSVWLKAKGHESMDLSMGDRVINWKLSISCKTTVLS